MTFIPFPLTSQIQCDLSWSQAQIEITAGRERKNRTFDNKSEKDEALGDLERENNSSYDLGQKYYTLSKIPAQSVS